MRSLRRPHKQEAVFALLFWGGGEKNQKATLFSLCIQGLGVVDSLGPHGLIFKLKTITPDRIGSGDQQKLARFAILRSHNILKALRKLDVFVYYLFNFFTKLGISVRIIKLVNSFT